MLPLTSCLQVSAPGAPCSHPVWDHSFVFCSERDKMTLFKPNAAVVIEFYAASACKLLLRVCDVSVPL